MEIRNAIMRKFHADPHTQLELKDLDGILIGDSDAKQEVLEFLDHWGLINFHPFPPTNEDASNQDAEEEKLASLLDKLYHFETVQSCPRFVPKKVEVSVPAATPRFVTEPGITEELVGPVGPSVEYHCNSCSADCSRKRYHCQKQADFDLCTECYNNEKFGSGMAPSDFILMEPAEVPGVSGGSWTDQETLLLLEALELFGENFSEIAEHVATKTKAQCILHFLQMPIEDPFLEGNDDIDDSIQEQKDAGSPRRETTPSEVAETKESEVSEKKVTDMEIKDQPDSSLADTISRGKDATELEASCENGPSIAVEALKAAFQAVGHMPEEEGLPSFAEAGNPVMALAVFLTQLVEPDAVSTSFRSSLKAMTEDSPGLQLATRHCFLLEDPPNDKMDLAATESAATATSNGGTAKEEDNVKAAKEEDNVKASNSNEEPISCTDNNEDSADQAMNKDCPAESEKVPCIDDERVSVKSDGNQSVENKKTGNGKCSNENEKKISLKNDTSCQIENEKAELESDKAQPMEIEERNSSVDNRKDMPIEREKNSSPCLQDCSDKPSAAEVSRESLLPIEAATSAPSVSGLSTPPGDQKGPDSMKDGSDSVLPTVLSTSNPEDSGNQTSPGEQKGLSSNRDGSDSATPVVLFSTNPNDAREPGMQEEATTGTANEFTKVESVVEDGPSHLKDSGNLATVDVVEQITETSMVVDVKPLPDEQESKQKGRSGPTVESCVASDGDDGKLSPSNGEKESSPTETCDDQIKLRVNKLRRAAVTVLSAAAVKAKLLANQEEDQIRQLVSLMIEKQLYKLEAKLALFTDVENVILRMREQTDKARQRIMQERAQIIAARLGLAAAGRGNPTSLPPNRYPIGHGVAGSNLASISSLRAQSMRRP